VKIEDFYPYVLTEALGCPEPLLRSVLVQSAAEFCRDTLAWTEIQDPVPLVNGISDYELDTPIGAYAITVRDVWIGGRPLVAATMDVMLGYGATPGRYIGSEPTHYNAAVERGSIRVFPQPSEVSGQALVFRTAFAPIPNATVLPDFLGQRCMEAIAAGAKMRLFAMSAQPWSNPAMASYNLQLFANAVVNARIEEAHDRVPGTISVPPRRFGF
jgi:hypothetical protein